MNINAYREDSLQIKSALAPALGDNFFGATHYSQGSIGGFVEVPTLEDLYLIPSELGPDTVNPDGLSSGKRKIGMIVYVIEQNKYFQLKPKFKDSKKVIGWNVLNSISPSFLGFLMNPAGFSFLERTNSVNWVYLESLVTDAVITNEDLESLEKYGYRDGSDLVNDVLIGVGVEADGIIPDGGIPDESDPWVEVFVKGNFNTLQDLNDYINSDSSAYAGQICSVTDDNKVYLVVNTATVGVLGLQEIGIGGGGGDDLLNDDLQVKGVSIGSYEDGELIEKDTPLETIIRNILQKRIPPTYTQPAFSIQTTTTLSHEIGSSISPQITASWSQNNAGSLIAYNLYKDSSLVLGPSSSIPLTHFTDSSFVLSSSVSYSGSVTWLDGDVLDNNMSEPDPGICPNCRVISNSGNPKISNTITFVPKRAAFYTADAGTSIPTASQIRGFTKNLNIVNGSTFTINISTTVKRIVIAYLKSYGLMSSVVDSGTGYNIVSSFGAPSEVLIEGANGYESALYYVYTFILSKSYPGAVTYTVTI